MGVNGGYPTMSITCRAARCDDVFVLRSVSQTHASFTCSQTQGTRGEGWRTWSSVRVLTYTYIHNHSYQTWQLGAACPISPISKSDMETTEMRFVDLTQNEKSAGDPLLHLIFCDKFYTCRLILLVDFWKAGRVNRSRSFRYDPCLEALLD